MELKFYLRGLGLGIIVTALIMGIAGSKNQTMTDAEIIARAKQLGMIEDTVLKEKTSEEDNDLEKKASEDEKDLPEGTSESDQSAQPEEENTEPESDADTEADETDTDMNTDDIETDEDVEGMGALDTETEDTDSDTIAESIGAETGQDNSDTSVVITIGTGDGSYSASLKLVDAGLISSASDFDNFLCENGYDKRVRAGTYTIPAGASEEQMARILTGAE